MRVGNACWTSGHDTRRCCDGFARPSASQRASMPYRIFSSLWTASVSTPRPLFCPLVSGSKERHFYESPFTDEICDSECAPIDATTIPRQCCCCWRGPGFLLVRNACCPHGGCAASSGQHTLPTSARQIRLPRGYKFGTYATWWIRQSISRSLSDRSRTIRMPVHMTEAANKIARTTRQMFGELGREPTPEELAKKLHMPLEKVRHILKISKEPLSLETLSVRRESPTLGLDRGSEHNPAD